MIQEGRCNMAPRNSRTPHPAMSQQVEQMLTARGIQYDFEPNVQLAEIRNVEGIQVRLTEHRAPKDQVAKYSVAMKHGAQFPAIILNDRLERIDGNTRLEARIKNGDTTIPAYICHNLTPLQARSLSIELNQSNGLAMTEQEIRSFVEGAVQEGQHADIRSFSRMTGVSETKLQRWVAEALFIDRAKNERIDERHVSVLPPSTRAALNSARLAAVFRDITQLAAEARIPAAGVKKLVAQANQASSESDALAVVAAEREIRGDEIRAVGSGFSPRYTRRSNGSVQHLGGLARFGVEDLLDVDPEKQFETFQRVRLIRDLLDEVVKRAEQEWDLTPPADEPEDQIPSQADFTTGVAAGVA
jgi:hypothetical protein